MKSFIRGMLSICLQHAMYRYGFRRRNALKANQVVRPLLIHNIPTRGRVVFFLKYNFDKPECNDNCLTFSNFETVQGN